MNLKELQGHATEVQQRLDDHYRLNGDKRTRLLAHMVKIQEEVGELSDELLTYLELQRQHKLDKAEKGNLEKEIADVIISTCTFAMNLGVDLDEAITRRMEIVKTRKLEG